MNLAVLLYADAPENPDSIPGSWPYEIIQLGKGTDLPGPSWVLMTDGEYSDYVNANQAEYETWRLAKVAAEPSVDKSFFFPSLAVGFENIDVVIPDDQWMDLAATRVIWDTNNNYKLGTSDFVVNRDGIYSFDIQAAFKELINVKYVEIAVFKREEPEDDYWFIIGKINVPAGETEVHLGGSTSFDFYGGDRVCVKVKIYKADEKLPCSCKINGSDDYTAWGYNLIRNI